MVAAIKKTDKTPSPPKTVQSTALQDTDKPYQVTVDVEDNRLDLRPIVRAIMTAENWILDRIPEDQKLVVILGENHSLMWHTALQQAVISAHLAAAERREGRNFAFGYELPHNGVVIATSDDNLKWTDEGNKNLFRFCVEQGVNLQFNDASHYQDEYDLVFDQQDAFTRDIIAKHAPKSLDKKFYRQAENHSFSAGLRLSNMVIAAKASEHMERTGARVYLQDCGLSHALGNRDIKHPYDDSLAAFFKRAGFAVLTVFPSIDHDPDDIPDVAFYFENIIGIEGFHSSELVHATTQKIWEDMDKHSGGILKDPSKVTPKMLAL